jgi:hypothetical protein
VLAYFFKNFANIYLQVSETILLLPRFQKAGGRLSSVGRASD